MNAAQKAAPKVNELDWKPHPVGMGGHQAVVQFDNGYGASVLKGGPFYTKNGTYEVAVIDAEGNLTCETPVTDDVLGYLSESEANEALAQIAALPKVGAA